MESKKSYYAIIPADVRYDKNLTNGAKLLYGEITALCNEKGFCWATSKYFADLYENDSRTIRRWIQSLVARRYILVEITDDVNRKIFLCEGGQKCPKGRTKMSGGVGQKRPHNNTSNTTINTTKASPFVWADYLEEMYDNKDRAINVIADFFENKKLSFDTRDKAQVAIKRYIKVARDVAKFSDDEIINATKKAKRDYGDMCTVETILKVLTK